MNTKAKEKNEFQEYWEIFKHKQLWIFGLIIPVLLEGTLIARDYLFGNLAILEVIKKINVLSTGILYILSVVLLSIPKYCIERIRLITNEVNDQMKKLEKCPKMMALHTDNEVLEDKLELIKKSTDHKWLLSELLSKMIAINCKDFSFYISSISEFTKFTSALATKGIKEVKFYTTISIFKWLDSFSDEDRSKDKFYNNLEQEFPLNKDLLGEHFISLIASNEISTKRYVFLSQFEWDNKYLSERYLDAYYKINNIDGKENKHNIYFIDKNKSNWNEDKKPFDDEYVIYDNAILLSYKSDKQNNKHLLSYVSDKEFNSKKEILNRYTIGDYCLDYHGLKEKIIEQKISMLEKIINNPDKPKISHTLSFLFRGNDFWQNYQRRERRFNDYSRRALSDGLITFVEGNKELSDGNRRYKIVEIGPGDGSKTKLILNTLGAENIHEYHLIDVNDVFLDIAENILEDMKKDNKFKHKKHLLDICDNIKRLDYKYLDDGDEKRIADIFENSVVIIATNSSLFCEDDFNLDIFFGCKAILSTIQVFSGEEKEEDFIEAKYSTFQRLDLLIHPLRAFDIPIDNTKAKDYLNVKYKDDNLKINFRLKDYLSTLEQNGIEMNVKNSENLSCYTEKYKRDYSSYKNLLNEFTNSEEIIIYETLKFEDKCGGNVACKDCKQNCNIRESPCFDGFNVQFGFTKDHEGLSKYVFVLLK
jgi:hypothetical protein